MSTERSPLERDLGSLFLRLTVGGLMLFHGVDKLIGGIDWLPAQFESSAPRLIPASA